MPISKAEHLTSFDTVAWGNWEMAYYFLNFALSDAILKLERSRELGLF